MTKKRLTICAVVALGLLVAWLLLSGREAEYRQPAQVPDSVADFSLAVDGNELSEGASFAEKDEYEITGRFRDQTAGSGSVIAEAFVLIDGTEVVAQSAVLNEKQDGDSIVVSGALGKIPAGLETQLRIRRGGKVLGSRPLTIRSK